ncbi:MAG: Uma2 family endonuclease [Proteobacteria bacterium]|nr:Uma2 family endonuclease [Pseudomonadota bacterium]
MGSAAEQLRMSSAEFLAWEMTQAAKHEFVAGEVFATAGAEDRHVTVTLNIAMALRQQLRGTPCRTFMSDIDRRQCDVFRKGEDGLWVLHPFARGETVQLASVALDLPADQLFAEMGAAGSV